MTRILIALGLVACLASARPAAAGANVSVVIGSPGFGVFGAAPCSPFVAAPAYVAPPFYAPPIYAPYYAPYTPPVYAPAPFVPYYGYPYNPWYGLRSGWYYPPYYGGRSERIYGYTLPGRR